MMAEMRYGITNGETVQTANTTSETRTIRSSPGAVRRVSRKLRVNMAPKNPVAAMAAGNTAFPQAGEFGQRNWLAMPFNEACATAIDNANATYSA